MSIELNILDFIQKIRTPLGDVLMCTITKLGNVGILWILLTLTLLLIPKMRKTGIILATALVIDVILCNGILKNIVARTRPFDINTSIALIIEKPLDFSFPSGHTAASFAAVSALYFSGAKKLWKISFGIACLIAFSRMYLYVHYPTDILGGMIVGGFAGYIGYRLCHLFWEKNKN